MAIVAAAFVAWWCAIVVLATRHAPYWATLSVSATIPLVVGGAALTRRLRVVVRRDLEPSQRSAQAHRAKVMPVVVSGSLIVVELTMLARYVPVIASGHIAKDAWQTIAIYGGNLVMTTWFLVRGNRPPNSAAAARSEQRLRAYYDARLLPPGPDRTRARAAVRRDFAYKFGLCALAIGTTIALGPALGWIVAIIAAFGPLVFVSYIAERRPLT